MNNWTIQDTAKVMLLARLALEAESSREAFKTLTQEGADQSEQIMCRFSDNILKQAQQDHIILGVPPLKLATLVWQIERLPMRKKTAAAFGCEIVETDPEMMNEKKDPAQCFIYPRDRCTFEEEDEDGFGAGVGRLDSDLMRGMPRKAFDELICDLHQVKAEDYSKLRTIKNRLYVDEAFEIPFLINFYSANPAVGKGEQPVWFNMFVLLHNDSENNCLITEWQPYILSHVKSKITSAEQVELAKQLVNKDGGSYYMKKWDVVKKELDECNLQACSWWSWLQNKLKIDKLKLNGDDIPLIEDGFTASPASWRFPQTLQWKWNSASRDFSAVVNAMSDGVSYIGLYITSEATGLSFGEKTQQLLEKKKIHLRGIIDQFKSGCSTQTKLDFSQAVFKMPHFIQQIAVERAATVDLEMMRNRSTYEKPLPKAGKDVEFPQELLDKHPQLAQCFFDLVGRKRPASEASTETTVKTATARQRVGEDKGKVQEVVVEKKTPQKKTTTATPQSKSQKKAATAKGKARLRKTKKAVSSSEAEVSGDSSGDEGDYETPTVI